MDSGSAVIADIGDPHINSSVALCPDAVALDDGGTYRPSKAQRWINRCWAGYWNEVEAEVAAHKAQLYIVIKGDLVEGFHHGSTQVISTNEATQMAMAIAMLEPLAQMTDYLFIVRGTAAHAGQSAHWEETLADDLGAVRDEEADTASWWHLPLEVAGVRFDFTHHPTTAGWRPWTEQAAAARQSAIVAARYAETGDRPPDVASYGHVHYFADSGMGKKPRVFFGRPWQLKTAYVHRRGGAGRVVPVGGLIHIVKGGELMSVRDVHYRPRRRRRWTN